MATGRRNDDRSDVRSAERDRLAAAADPATPWRRWGPYLSERQWGTVREDYSADGSAWTYLPHDHARSRAYRWGEDGILGICDDRQRLCFALAVWNGVDPILKERLFGLGGPEGNHGEDVKELYWYLDATPTSSFLRARYAYPQRAFPYDDLVAENGRRTKADPEYEVLDSGIFDDGRWFDLEVEYAKAGPEDIVIAIVATNRGPEPATLHLLPTLWFRNTWSWGSHHTRPRLRDGGTVGGGRRIVGEHPALGRFRLDADGEPALLFTENETNAERLFGAPNPDPYVKDGIGEAVVLGRLDRVSPDGIGSKAAVHHRLELPAGGSARVRLRLRMDRSAGAPATGESSPEGTGSEPDDGKADPFARIDDLLDLRRREADAFYAPLGGSAMTADERQVQRQAFAGLLWSKQWYHYDVGRWLDGDPGQPPPPPERRRGRNRDWRELNTGDVLSMPDTWEYPWFAAWDLAFHAIPLAQIDPEAAKEQLLHLTREWYMHPNGQLPAYEWAFSDVNPPVHAWAARRVYQIDARVSGRRDRDFLERIFHKLLLNFTWWVNRKDADGNNVFQGGFLGLDNVGVFDRSAPLPVPGHLGQADGTAWMGMYSLSMLAIALELAREDPVYEDIATKFFEHFLYIAGALNGVGLPDGERIPLWDESDEFFYDVLHLDSGPVIPLRIRSLVGLMPMLAVETLDADLLDRLPGFRRRMRWFLANRPELASLVASWEEPGIGRRRLLALVHGHRLKRLLARMLDPDEFLSDHGVRSLSRYHRDHPFSLDLDGTVSTVDYEPAESRSGTFGGNSNWRGPIWFPINYLIIEALQRFHHYYGPEFTVEHPTGSGTLRSLVEVADDLSRRLEGLFLPGSDGRRPALGANERLATDPAFGDLPLFFEYFNSDTGAGLGASHQTGWTSLVAKLLEQTSTRSMTTADDMTDRASDGATGR
ncbi:MAG: MGH1-like glycoside hydrolase domain-containing protein [Candidatus Limnocylindrales bacterium]